MSEPIRQEVELPGTPEAVYEALMDAEKHAELSGGAETRIRAEPGGEFSCHGGQITGRTIELVPGRRIVQAWRVAAWDEGVYSLVRVELEPAGDGTRLRLEHSSCPDGTREHLAEGWRARYWDPLKAYLS